MDPKDWTDIENNPTFLDVMAMRRRVRAVCQRKIRMAMFCSAPGLGKTYEIRRECKRAGLKAALDAPTSSLGFCTSMWLAKTNDAKIYVLDDADAIARSEPMLNIAKTAWDSSRVTCPYTRRIVDNENRRMEGGSYDPTLPPPNFAWDLGVLWASNKNFADEAVRRSMKVRADFDALLNRGLDPIWINSDPRNVCLYTVWMMVRGNLLRNIGLGMAEQEEVLTFFCQHAPLVPHPNLRMAVRLAKLRCASSYREHWADLVRSSQQSSDPRVLTRHEFRTVPSLREDVAQRKTTGGSPRPAGTTDTRAASEVTNVVPACPPDTAPPRGLKDYEKAKLEKTNRFIGIVRELQAKHNARAEERPAVPGSATPADPADQSACGVQHG